MCNILTGLWGGEDDHKKYCFKEVNLILLIIILFLPSDPPSIDVGPVDVTLFEGNSTVLFCNATGNPQPNITWTKVGGGNEVLSSTPKLNLDSVAREKDGEYKCTVSNGVEPPAVRTARITVYCKFVMQKFCIPCAEPLIVKHCTPSRQTP